MAEGINPTAEDTYWREQHVHEPYYEKSRSYEDYGPAYRVGYMGRERNYTSDRGTSSLDWNQARPAARAAWDRVDRTQQPGGPVKDGQQRK